MENSEVCTCIFFSFTWGILNPRTCDCDFMFHNGEQSYFLSVNLSLIHKQN